jgi:hypothetical protein
VGVTRGIGRAVAAGLGTTLGAGLGTGLGVALGLGVARVAGRGSVVAVVARGTLDEPLAPVVTAGELFDSAVVHPMWSPFSPQLTARNALAMSAVTSRSFMRAS